VTGPPLPFPTSRTILDGVVEHSDLTILHTQDGCSFTFQPDGADPRAERGELLGCLVGAVAILAEIKDPIGRAYRGRLVARIKSIIEREKRALGVL
jgi:hypothetical protein